MSILIALEAAAISQANVGARTPGGAKLCSLLMFRHME
jgi:hypothetical protein